jgi:FlaA1/EpsC-like NDP-sugar epimerase
LSYLRKDKQTVYDVVGFIDDEPRKRNSRLNGVKILGDRHHLKLLTQLYKIQGIFLAMHNVSEAEMQQATKVCRNLGLETWVFQLRTTASSEVVAEDLPKGDRRFSPDIPTTLSVVRNHKK